MTTEIQHYQPATVNTWHLIEQIAPTMKKSALFGVSSVEQAMSIMLMGHEHNIPLTSSFQHIHIIQGKPTWSPKGGLALVRRSGLLKAMRCGASGSPSA